MDTRAIQSLLHERFGAAIAPVESARLFEFIEVDPLHVDAIARFLRDEPELAFDCLSNLSGCDWPKNAKIQVVYELYSFTHDRFLVIKADARRDHPQVKTVEGVWPAANWLEREVFDLLGVDFVGHSDQRRILLPDDWIGSPLRKDYVEAPEYHGISTVRESVLNMPSAPATAPSAPATAPSATPSPAGPSTTRPVES